MKRANVVARALWRAYAVHDHDSRCRRYNDQDDECSDTRALRRAAIKADPEHAAQRAKAER